MSEVCPKCGFEGVDAAECPGCGVIVSRYRVYMSTMGPAAEPSPPGPAPLPLSPPAGLVIRAGAMLVDSLVLKLIQFVLEATATALWGETPTRSRVAWPALRAFEIIFLPLYFVLFHWLWGQTFGKMLVGVRVVTVNGGALSLGTAMLRVAGLALSVLTLGFGFLLAGLREDKRALHDLVAGTRVERAR